MPLIRYAEVVGSAAADSFQGAANTVYFGLGGNDAMVTAAGSPVTVFVGGGGSDQYTLSNNSTTVIIDLDHSGTLNAPGMSVAPFQNFLGATTFAARINGNHLLLFDSASGQRVVIVDGAGSLSGYNLGGQFFTLNTFSSMIGGAPNNSWESIGFNTADVEEAIAYYKSRNFVAPEVPVFNSTIKWNETRFLGTTASDGDGNAIVRYEYRDETTAANSGYIVLNGQRQPAGQAITVTPFASIDFHAGSVPGTDTISIRAFDGTFWSDWKSFTITTTGQPPAISVQDRTLLNNQVIPVAVLIRVTAFDDPVTQYEFIDDGADAGSGHFLYQGVSYNPGQTVTVDASGLSNLQYVAGSVASTDTIRVRMYAGGYTDYTSFEIASGNAGPIITAADRGISRNQSLAATSLFSASDREGDSITRYRFLDTGSAADSGHFTLNSIAQNAGQSFELNAADLAGLQYVGGAQPGAETLTAQAFDGTSWGPATSWSMNTVNNAPVATAADASVVWNRSVSLGSLIAISDVDGDTPVQYELWDSGTQPDSGHFAISGQAQGAAQTIAVSAANFAQTAYVGGSAVGAERVWVRAYDGAEWSAWTSWMMASTDSAPQVSASNGTVQRSAAVAASGLFTVTDADADTAARYEFWDSGADSGSGYFAVNGVPQSANQTIAVLAANLAQVSFVGGATPGTELVWVRANDGLLWSDWKSWSMTTQGSPPVATASSRTLHPGTTVAASTLFSVSDADGDAIAQYRFWDSGAAATSGHFVLNNVAQSANSNINVSAANLSNLQWIAGSAPGSETVWVQASDGGESGFGAWVNWTMTTGNNLPVATPASANRILHAGQSVSAAALFNASDADGDAITQYNFWDGGAGAGSGHFTIGVTSQNANTNINVLAADLANVQWVAGSTPGSETVWVQASDAGGFGAWVSWSMTTGNSFPVATPTSANRILHVGQSLPAEVLFNTANSDGDPITAYQFWDSGGATDSGHFTVNGAARPANANIDISAADLANTQWLAGSAAGSETVWVRASDAGGFGEWVSWTMTSRNNLPVATPVSANRSLHVGQSVLAASLFNASDADNDAIGQYRFWDSGASASSGYFSINGVPQSANSNINVSAAGLGNVQWVAGSAPGTETVWVQASDATGFGNWVSWTMTSSNNLPVATPASAERSVHVGQSVSAQSLISVADGDGDAITQYRFWDSGASPASGHFTINGVTQSANTNINVPAANLATVNWIAGSAPGSETVWVQASDGGEGGFGAWVNWTMTSADVAPVITAADRSVHSGQPVAASSLFSVTDADNDAIVQYQFWDGGAAQSSGYFALSGVRQGANQAIDVSAAQLANVQFVGGAAAGTEMVWVRASDGAAYSAWTGWNMSSGNSAPVVTPANTLLHAGATVAASTLFTVSDPDGDAITQYTFRDDDATDQGGYFTLSGAIMPANAEFSVSAANLGQVAYVAGSSVRAESVSVRASDGAATGAWQQWYVGWGDTPPLVTAIDGSVSTGASVPVTAFFTASDADGDPITYHLSLEGTFALGSREVSFYPTAYIHDVDVTQSELATTRLYTFSTGSPDALVDVLTIRAFDGSLHTIKSANVTILPNHPPAITASDNSIVLGGQTAVSALFSVADADGDAVTQYEFIDRGISARSGHFAVSAVVQSAGQPFQVAAADLTQLNYFAGDTAGAEYLSVRANDGKAWGAWTDWRMTTQLAPDPSNVAPSVSAINAHLAFSHQSPVSALFSASDANGDAITQYEITANGPLSGTVRLNGDTLLPGTALVLSYATELPNMVYVAPGSPATDSLNVRAFDGRAWSSPVSVSIGVTANVPPVVTAADGVLLLNEEVAASTLFSVFDSDGDAMTQYELTDRSASSHSGHFNLNGIPQSASQTLQIAAADLARLTYASGPGAGAETLTARAFDGYQWSDAKDWRMTTQLAPDAGNSAPTVSATGAHSKFGQAKPVGASFIVSDADNDTITQYEITVNAPLGGSVTFGGAPLAPNTPVLAFADELASLIHTAGNSSGSDSFSVRAFDGRQWSAPANVAIAVSANRPPVVTASDYTFTSGHKVLAASLFSYSDADGDLINTGFELIDNGNGATSGHFRLDGFDFPANSPFHLTLSELNRLLYVSGTEAGSETVSARVFDGTEYGPLTTWTITTPFTNHAPVVVPSGIAVAAGEAVPLSQLFSISDSESDPMESYILQSSNDGGGGTVGSIVVDGNYGSFFSGPIADLSHAYYLLPSDIRNYHLSVSASDGLQTSATQTLDFPVPSTPLDDAGNTFPAARALNLASGPQSVADWINPAPADDPTSDQDDMYSFSVSTAQTLHVEVSRNSQAVNLTVYQDAGGTSGGVVDSRGFQFPGGSWDLPLAAGNYVADITGATIPTHYALNMSLV